LKLTHKIIKLARPETYRRSWRNAQRLLHPIALGPLLAAIDQPRLREIQARYANSSEHYAKYADVERWLRLNIQRVQDLKLHRSSPRSVLDLGCGGGFFLFILQHFGHTCLGSDIDIFPLFTELLDLFQVRRKVWAIQPFEPLPDFGERFDLITAFSTAFNRNEERTHWWGPEEWRFFLDDLAHHLHPGGQIFLGLNPDNDGAYYTPALREFFLSRGAKVDRENVLLTPPSPR
jgi:SAM-dependent methyltransferase